MNSNQFNEDLETRLRWELYLERHSSEGEEAEEEDEGYQSDE
jgi:hypothetical protein